MLTKDNLKTATAVAVGFGIAFLIVGTSQTFQSCIDEHYHHESSETLQMGAGQFLIMFKVGLGCSGEFVHKNAEAIIALFTVILGIATWLLWRATKKLVEGADATAKRQLRAYVHVSEAKFSDFGFPSGVYMVNYTNTGQTPAHDVYSSIAIKFTKFPLSEDLEVVGNGTKGIVTIGRDGEGHARIEAPRGLTGEEYAAVRDGKNAVFDFGVISYRDVFGDKWTTDYRYYVGGDQGIRSDGFLASHSGGNKAT
jgi:hypothetical protein